MRGAIRTAYLLVAFIIFATAGLSAQEAPSRDRTPPPAAVPQPTEPQRAVPQPAANLVTTEATIDPAEPAAGQKIRVLAVVQNRGNAQSQRLQFVVRCAEIRGGPRCPSGTFTTMLPGIEPGNSQRVVVDLGNRWSAGKYGLATGTELPGDAKALELTIQPAPSLARADQGPVRARSEAPQPAGDRALNPQPEPPSEEARPQAGRPAAGRGGDVGRAVPEVTPRAAGREGDAGLAAPEVTPRAAVPEKEAAPVRIARPEAPPAPDRLAPNPSAPTVSTEIGPTGGAVGQLPGGTPMMMGADLAFAMPIVDKGLVPGGTETTVYKNRLKLQLIWSSPYTEAYDWRWQVSLWPFQQNTSLTPSALLQDGDVPTDVFWIDLGSFPPLGTAGPSTPMVSNAGAPTDVIAMGGNPSAAPAGGGETIQAMKAPPISEKPPSGDLPPAIDQVEAPPGAAVAGQTEAAGANLVQHDQPGPIDAPMDFHIRLIPTKNGQPAAPPSNVVVAHYVPGPSPTDEAIKKHFEEKAKKEKLLAEMTEKAKVYEVAILSWKPAVFEDPNRWGCVVVVTNPYYGKLHPLGTYKPGHEYCPPKDPSKMEKSTGEKILEGVEGFGKAWDGLAWAFDQAKKWVASKFAETFPCEWLGDDLESDCESVAQKVAEAAITVGLVAAGMPPSLPTVAELQGMAEGKVVDGAVEYTCDVIESNGGTCTPEMRAALAKIYQEALDQLQEDLKKQTQEPACGDVQTAKEQGVLPLPCFNAFPGTEVKPATGAVDESPQVTVRVRRLKPDPDFPLVCRLLANLFLENYFPGGNVGGSFSSKYVPAGPIQGYPFKAGQAALPGLAVGQSTVLTVPLGPKEPFFLPGNQWSPFQWSDWLALYRGGKGPLRASLQTTEAIAELPTGGYKTTLGCSEGAQMDVQIPHQL